MRRARASEAATWPVPGGELTGHVWPARRGARLVLALHGGGADAHAWSAVAERLREARLVAPKLHSRGRAHGGTAWSTAALADEAAAVIAAEGHDRAIVVGHGAGAFVAVRLAQRHPDLVEALVAIDGGLPAPLITPVGTDDGCFGDAEPADRDDDWGAVLDGVRAPVALVRAPRGARGADPVYPARHLDAWAARLGALHADEATGTTHDTILIDPRGADTITEAVRVAIGHGAARSRARAAHPATGRLRVIRSAGDAADR